MPKRLHASPKTPQSPVTRRRHVRNPEPGKHYHFARTDRVRILQDDLRYEVVTEEDGGPRRSGADILMKCSKTEFDARKRERRRRAADDRRGPIEAFKMSGLKSGVPTIDITRERQGSMKSVLGERDPRLEESS